MNFPHKIVIRTPNWLGDVMMSITFIQAALQKFPESQVDLILKKGFEQLPLPHRGKVWSYNKKQQGPGTFGKQLRSENYDVFYSLPNSFSSAWMAFWSGAKQRVGYAGEGRRLLLKPAISYQQPYQSQHLVTEYLQLLDPNYTQESFFTPWSPEKTWIEAHFPKSLDATMSYVVMAPGAIYGPAKQWPAAYFQEVAQELAAEGHSVLVIGTPGEVELGNTIAEGNANITNLCGKTSLDELVALLSKTSLLISNDSGSMHIASALQRPQIAVFGSTSQTWTGPHNPKAVCLSLNLDCSPCFEKECPLKHYRCLQDLPPKDVTQEALQILSKNL